MAKTGKRSKANVERVRQVVYDRDGGVCVAGGFMRPCYGDLTIQHRVGRGMGGSAQYDTSPSWLLSLCWGHNVFETENATAREAYKARGWSVSRWVVESWKIDDVPVLYFDGWNLLVHNERLPVDEKVALERMGAIYGRE
jgi:hypothetical protein